MRSPFWNGGIYTQNYLNLIMPLLWLFHLLATLRFNVCVWNVGSEVDITPRKQGSTKSKLRNGGNSSFAQSLISGGWG